LTGIHIKYILFLTIEDLIYRNFFIVSFSTRLGNKYVLYPKDIMEKDGVIHLPLYMAGLLVE
ncbi:MAG: hypothetical protein E7197_05885, partial [Anaerovibrio sp.]|uniref:hypothetical protein n=1 Tax=Anaerovibrio sp. TaxID=1872532 RepID=UPI0025C626EB